MMLCTLCLLFETWRPIKGYENYLVSDFGRVMSLDKTVIRKDRGKLRCKGTYIRYSTSADGYLRVNLSSNGYKKCFGVHRLVALAFIPNPDNLPTINHKNEDKTDNRVENLEWCNYIYNANYGTRNLRLSKWVYEQFTLKGEFLNTYSPYGLHKSGFDRGNCRAVALGKRKSYKGFLWRLKLLEV